MLIVFIIALQLFTGINKSFEQQLKNYLDLQLRSYDRYEFSVDKVNGTYSKIEIDTQREFRLNRNYGMVPIVLIDQNNRTSLSFVSVRLRLFKKVLVATQDVNRDEMISQFQFAVDVCEITNIKGTPFVEGENVDQLKTKTRISAGSVLLKEQTESIPDVENSDRLILHAGRNGVDITTDVIAREKGRIGDIIRVVNSENKIFRARIIDNFNVLLIE